MRDRSDPPRARASRGSRPPRSAAGRLSRCGGGRGAGSVGFDQRPLPGVPYVGCLGRILLGVVDERHGRPLGYPFGDAFGVPVRETDAAVRFRFGHASREWGAMDSVAVGRKIDPHRADRIVRAWLDGERLPGMDTLEVVGRVIPVGRIGVDLRYFQGA
jgi:hypothetical protein